LTPKMNEGVTQPVSASDYDIPEKKDLDSLIDRFKEVRDLVND